VSGATTAPRAPKTSTAPAKSPVSPFLSERRGILQRKCACGGSPGLDDKCDECRQNEMGLQRLAVTPAASNAAPRIVHDVLRSPGQPLDTATRASLEPRFGHDFGRVRIHADATAAESARAADAHAYTVGSSIVFGAGRYAPGTESGRRLLAHELTHVIQQGDPATSFSKLSALPPDRPEPRHVFFPFTAPSPSGMPPPKLVVAQAEDPLEREADRVADQVMRMPDPNPSITLAPPQGRAFLNLIRGIAETDGGDVPSDGDPNLYQANGVTSCRLPGGTPTTTINNTDVCTSPCTVRHEGVHSADIAPCCTAAGRAYDAAATPTDKAAAKSSFVSWLGGNREWFECRAYAESVRCADGYLGTSVISDQCKTTLSSYRASMEANRANNCAAAGPTLSACPFP
jgi:hypothetical protein